MPCSATRLILMPSSTASFTTPTASISPATASGADLQIDPKGIDHRPATLPKIYCQQGARQPGDTIPESAGDFVGICTMKGQKRCGWRSDEARQRRRKGNRISNGDASFEKHYNPDLTGSVAGNRCAGNRRNRRVR